MSTISDAPTVIPIYTCVVGGYERRLYPPAAQSRDVRFICFTDSPLQDAAGWELRPLLSPPAITRPDLISKYHKFFAAQLFPAARQSIWIDANIQIVGDLAPLLDQVAQDGAALGICRHPWSTSYRDEYALCRKQQRFVGDDATRAAAQIAEYQSLGVPEDAAFASGLLIRRHDDAALTAAMELWWQQVTRFTARDQISLPYVLWASGLRRTVFDLDLLRHTALTRYWRHGLPAVDAAASDGQQHHELRVAMRQYKRTAAPLSQRWRRFQRKIRLWRRLIRLLRGVTARDQWILLQSLAADVLPGSRVRGRLKLPTTTADCQLRSRGVGTFHVRGGSDDLFHVLPQQEPAVEAAIRRSLQPGAVFVDAGSNIGYYSVLAAQLVGPHGRVIAVEMMPETAAALRRHVAINDCRNTTRRGGARADGRRYRHSRLSARPLRNSQYCAGQRRSAA
jgi:hypothetical protein